MNYLQLRIPTLQSFSADISCIVEKKRLIFEKAAESVAKALDEYQHSLDDLPDITWEPN